MGAFQRRWVRLYHGEQVIADLTTIAETPEENYVISGVLYEVHHYDTPYRKWDDSEGWDVHVRPAP